LLLNIVVLPFSLTEVNRKLAGLGRWIRYPLAQRSHRSRVAHEGQRWL